MQCSTGDVKGFYKAPLTFAWTTAMEVPPQSRTGTPTQLEEWRSTETLCHTPGFPSDALWRPESKSLLYPWHNLGVTLHTCSQISKEEQRIEKMRDEACCNRKPDFPLHRHGGCKSEEEELDRLFAEASWGLSSALGECAALCLPPLEGLQRGPYEHQLGIPTSRPQSKGWGSHGKVATVSSFPIRHTPHPRRVCHIKGLNNTPICAVNDDDLYRPWSVGQLSHLEKEENSLAKYSVPSTVALLSPGRGLSPTPGSLRIPERPQSAPCRKSKECFRTYAENPSVIKKEEIKAQHPPSLPKACSTAGSCSSEAWSTKAAVREKTFSIPNYLDQEIKILAKLCDILHTDSLGDVLQWLLRASSKEKEWVSTLIHAELSEMNLLTHFQRNPSAHRSTQNRKQSTVKAPPHSLAKSKCKEGHPLSRASSHGSEEEKEVSKEGEQKPPLFIRRNNVKIPVAEYFSKSVPLATARSQESSSARLTASRNTQKEHNRFPRKAFNLVCRGQMRPSPQEAHPTISEALEPFWQQESS
ncbi:uncharacterized protein C4orf17 homolog [Suncus etruscus]|uniref:uncharacterized protein C4orf17 homolog n=1 Tax=Suncus etruscus TaxID=109475 RepID=UPI0021103747|nr:uncharacterized protein C4orf17 homolog [Suncus etruscus]